MKSVQFNDTLIHCQEDDEKRQSEAKPSEYLLPLRPSHQWPPVPLCSASLSLSPSMSAFYFHANLM